MTLLDRIASGRSSTPAHPDDPARGVLLPGTVLARLAAHVDATRTGSWEVEPIEQLPDLRDARVRVGRELVQVASVGSVAHVQPKVQERLVHRLTFATRGNWHHRSGEPIWVGDQVVGRLDEAIDAKSHQMRTALSDPDQVRVGSVLQVAGERAEVERIDVERVSEEVPGRGETVLKPALLVNRRGLDGPTIEHFPQEAIVYAPHHAVAIPGPGVDQVHVEAEANDHGQLTITTGPEPQAGQLAQIHFGESLYGARRVLPIAEAGPDGDSLAVYGMAPRQLTAAGFSLMVASPPRPSTSYRLSFEVRMA